MGALRQRFYGPIGALRGPAHPSRWWPRCSTKQATCAANARSSRCDSEVPAQERRAQRTHPEYHFFEFLRHGAESRVVRDITRLLGPKKRSYYYLYVDHGHLQLAERRLMVRAGPGSPSALAGRLNRAALPEPSRPAPGPDPALGSGSVTMTSQ